MIRHNYLKKTSNVILKKKVRPQFCFVQPKWRLGWTYALSRKKNYLQPCAHHSGPQLKLTSNFTLTLRSAYLSVLFEVKFLTHIHADGNIFFHSGKPKFWPGKCWATTNSRGNKKFSCYDWLKKMAYQNALFLNFF